MPLREAASPGSTWPLPSLPLLGFVPSLTSGSPCDPGALPGVSLNTPAKVSLFLVDGPSGPSPVLSRLVSLDGSRSVGEWGREQVVSPAHHGEAWGGSRVLGQSQRRLESLAAPDRHRGAFALPRGTRHGRTWAPPCELSLGLTSVSLRSWNPVRNQRLVLMQVVVSLQLRIFIFLGIIPFSLFFCSPLGRHKSKH